MWSLAQIFTPDWTVELWQHVPVLMVRTILSFVTVLVVVRWTGKRSIANLAPFDLAMVIMIGEVAAIPVSELKVDLLHGILPVAMIGGLHVATTTLAMRSKRFEEWTEGHATLLVKDGQVLTENLRKERVSMADLVTSMRHKEVLDVAEVEEAWIEHAGGISVIRRRDGESVPPEAILAAFEESIERIVSEHHARLRAELAELLQQYCKRAGG